MIPGVQGVRGGDGRTFAVGEIGNGIFLGRALMKR